MLDLAVHILKSKKAHFEPDKFEDRYEDALVALIKAKHAGKPIPKLEEAKPSNVINLMDALKRSVKAEQGGAKSAPARRSPARRASAGTSRKRAAHHRTAQAGELRSKRRWRTCGPITPSATSAKPPSRAARPAAKRASRYVIQKHDATRLHYDLRLELDGVMLSWAVTRGPSLVPGEKRLAIHVEDHPIEYNKFEGTIPKGQYGGGTVMVWDRGTWTPDHDPHKGMQKGHLDFELHGEKLKGHWHLVRMRKRPGERQEPWLLIKATDEFAAQEIRSGHSRRAARTPP